MEYWIVVVDDEAVSLTEAKCLLDGENMRVSCLRSGRNLLKFIERHTPDLILLDILMPEMDGFETYHALRRYEEQTGRSNIPVIFLTGEDDTEIERRGLKAGASDFIHKPFDRDILTSRIRNTIMNHKTIESLEEEATVDKLTGFLNKSSGSGRIAHLCKESSGAFLIMDLDSFKLVNDLFGHDMGDRVLQVFADIVRHNTRETDVISRIGGDEFLAFFDGVAEESEVASLTRRLNSQLLAEAARLMGNDNGIPLGISIGAVTVPEYGRNYDTLFGQADTALYSVKQNGKHGYAFYRRDDNAVRYNSDDGSLEAQIERMAMIMNERNEQNGAMLLGSEAFANVYRFIMRLTKRYQVDATELLFHIVPGKENADPRVINESAAQFGRIVQKALRRSDIIMQNRPDQFFLFLPSMSGKDLHIVTDRILNRWNETEYASRVKIEYASRSINYSGEYQNEIK